MYANWTRDGAMPNEGYIGLSAELDGVRFPPGWSEHIDSSIASSYLDPTGTDAIMTPYTCVAHVTFVAISSFK
jgi:hypothetical protein